MIKPYRRRYLLFKVITAQHKIDWNNVKRTIFESFQTLFGITGLSKANLIFIHYDEENGWGVLRCNHTELDNVRASLAFVQAAGEEKISLNVLTVSGTIKTIKEATSMPNAK